jgi:hypothetical protein
MMGYIYTNSGPWLQVAVNPALFPPVNNNNIPMQGVIRIMSGKMQAWDGNQWLDIHQGTAHVDISEDTKMILNWAKQKMREENTTIELATTHPAVAEAMEMVHHAEDRLKIVVELTKENKNAMV